MKSGALIDKMKIILASLSPRRDQLLRDCGLDFRVYSEPTEEKDFAGRPSRTVRYNAEKKARAVARAHPAAAVIAADTVVYLRKILGKPKDLREAGEMLRLLSGRTHRVYTAVSLYLTASRLMETRVEITKVRFKRLDSGAIRRYIRLVNTLDKAGAYAIQEHGEMLVEGISGSLSNVIGLPLEEVAALFSTHPDLSYLVPRIEAALQKLPRKIAKFRTD